MGRGGKRAGAGRPKGTGSAEPTKVMRVPASQVQQVKQLIQGSTHALPFYSSRVSAGFPSPADDHVEDRLDLNEHIIKNPVSTFFVEVTGESMIDAGIYPNDILVVDKSVTPSHGKVAIVFFNSEFTVKRLEFENDKLVYLIPENKNYQPIPVTAADEVEIWGMVTHVIHSF